MTRFARSRTRQALLILLALALPVLFPPRVVAGDAELIRQAFDEIAPDRQRLHDPALWWSVLKNVRAGVMPPAEKPRPNGPEQKLLEDWIKTRVFEIDPGDPDPG